MRAHARPRLVVIVDPIAVGKSTLAFEVGRRLRDRGESSAVVGLDSVAEMALPSLEWAWAHDVHAQLVRAWLETSVQTVIAEGPGTSAELDLLMRCVPSGVGALTVVLTAPYEIALGRAELDPGRVLSRRADFLARDHERFARSRPHLAGDLALDSADATPASLARLVLTTLDHRRASHR